MHQLDTGTYRPVVNLRPEQDWPDTSNVGVDLARVAAVLDRIAADIAELSRARRVQDLNSAAIRPQRRSERRRRLAELDLDFATFCQAKRIPHSGARHLELAWDAWQNERLRRGEIDQRPAYTDNPYRAQ